MKILIGQHDRMMTILFHMKKNLPDNLPMAVSRRCATRRSENSRKTKTQFKTPPISRIVVTLQQQKCLG